MSKSIRFAVLASGRGSGFESIVKAQQAGVFHSHLCVLLTDRKDALALEKAKKYGVPTVVIESKNRTREEHEKEMIQALKSYDVSFLVLAGYRRILTRVLIEEFKTDRGYSRIVNVHPSLLPSFPGLHGYHQAFSYGVKQTGVTVHLVTEELDSGPICAQQAFSIEDCGTPEEVEERGLAIEHNLYPKTLEWVLPENFTVEQREFNGMVRKVCVH